MGKKPDLNMEEINTNLVLENFANPSHEWFAENDPVMGGQSHSSFSFESGLGVFDGEVKDVSFLHAPGFITMRGDGSYPDASSCEALQITARAATSYSGYRVSFGNRHVAGNHHAFGYKANFDLPMSSQMSTVVIPFDQFTVRWDDATGDAIVTCAENEDFCPDIETLRDMKTISLWGEGVNGEIKLEVESIQAMDCSSTVSVSRVESSLRIPAEEKGMKFATPSFIVGVGVAALAAFVGVFFWRNRKKSQYQNIDQSLNTFSV